MQTKGRYVTLDLLRGVAAIAIVIYHCFQRHHQHTSFHAYLAVDFFFVLSGFVVSGAFDRRLEQEGFWRFAETRVIRLAPMIWLGIAIGFPVDVVIWHRNWLWEAKLIAEGAVAFPSFRFHEGSLFPLNVPMWSVHYELLVNGLYAIGLFRIRKAGWACITAALGVALATTVISWGSLDMGWGGDQWLRGLLRASFGFSLGVWMRRLASSQRSVGWSAAAAAAAVIVVLLLPVPHALAWQYDILAGMILMPALLWFCIHCEVPAPFEKPAKMLGLLSYPLYATHFPLAALIVPAAAQRIGLWPTTGLFVAFALGVAWCAETFVDEPLRKRFSRAAHVPASALPVEAV